MIGVLKGRYIFEFSNNYQLAQAIDNFVKKYDDRYHIYLILDSSFKYIGYGMDDSFVFHPMLSVETSYYVFCPNYAINVDELEKNKTFIDTHSSKGDIFPFKYVNYRFPKELDI